MSTSEKTLGERAPRGRDSLVSTQVNDFVIEERIGEGGMGVVYRAVHPLIGKQVAIKVLRAENVTQQQVEQIPWMTGEERFNFGEQISRWEKRYLDRATPK